MQSPSTSSHQILSLSDQLHTRALAASQRYRSAEAELIEVLQLSDQHRVYLHQGHSSLFAYVVNGLGLSESVAYNLITVSRKAREVPELKMAIQSGVITLSNARKITSVLTYENKTEWLEKASSLSHRQLEKEVAKICPKEATPERATYVTETRVQLTLGLSESEMLKLRRVQDLLSQSQRKSVSLEEVITELSNEYLHRHDPLQKVKRMVVKKGSRVQLTQALNIVEACGAQDTVKPVTLQVQEKSQTKITPFRTPIPANILHQVNHRDQRRCTHLNQEGIRCNQSRFIEIHHQIPVSEGGKNTLNNLATLCSAHHRFVHQD